MREAMILPCGKLTAPGIWLWSNRAALRTSSRTNPGAPLCIASCVSQQSVSKVNSDSKCAAAVFGGAAAIWVTVFGIEIPFRDEAVDAVDDAIVAEDR